MSAFATATRPTTILVWTSLRLPCKCISLPEHFRSTRLLAKDVLSVVLACLRLLEFPGPPSESESSLKFQESTTDIRAQIRHIEPTSHRMNDGHTRMSRYRRVVVLAPSVLLLGWLPANRYLTYITSCTLPLSFCTWVFSSPRCRLVTPVF
jgi:hypothetical protein